MEIHIRGQTIQVIDDGQKNQVSKFIDAYYGESGSLPSTPEEFYKRL
jgi:hypothetical protein